MFSIKSVYITVPHNSHSTILCVLTSMVYVALRQITVQYQIQISDDNTSIHSNTDRGAVTNYLGEKSLMRNLKASTSQLMTNKTDYYLNLNRVILHYEAHRSKLQHSQYYLY